MHGWMVRQHNRSPQQGSKLEGVGSDENVVKRVVVGDEGVTRCRWQRGCSWLRALPQRQGGHSCPQHEV